MSEMKSLTLNDNTYDSFVDGVARPLAEASAVVCSVSGESIALLDSSDLSLAGLNLYGKSTQAGTPTPDAPVDITSVGEIGDINIGVYGKNLINIMTGKVDGFTIVNTGTKITVSGTNANNYVMRVKLCDVKLRANVQYCLSGGLSVDNMLIVSKAIDTFEITSSGSAGTYTPTENATMGVYLRINAGQTLNATIYPQLEIGMTATSYAPYVGQTTTIGETLRGIQVTDKTLATYTDPKGQMWCADEIDFERGVRIQRVVQHQFTDNEKQMMVLRESTAGNTFVIGNPSIKIQEPSTNTESSVIISNIAKGIAYRSRGDKEYVSVYVGPGATFEIRDSVDNTLTLDEMLTKTITVEYILATPIETPLTDEEIAAYKALHTNKPNTTITNDENAYMSVKYIADPKAYIDNKVSGILAATVE